MAHVTIPAVIAGLLTCVLLELSGKFGYGKKLDPVVRDILTAYVAEEDAKRSPREVYGL